MAIMAKLPLQKVALLIGVTEYSSDSGYDTLESPKGHLADMLERLQQSGFTCRILESNMANNCTGPELIRLVQDACKELLAHQDTGTALVLCYCSGHGAIDKQGQACLVAANGDLVPIAGSLQPLMQPAKWTVLLVDACRQRNSSSSSTFQGIEFRIPFITPQHYLVGCACTHGTVAKHGLYTQYVKQAWGTGNKSVYEVVSQAAQLTNAQGTQIAETLCSGAGEEQFRAFSFARTLRQGNLFISQTPPQMVGRGKEQRQVEDALQNKRLCAIDGGPGEGKTLLAETVGLSGYNQGCYPAGVYKVDMRGCGALGVKQHLARVLTVQLKQADCLLESDPEDWQSVEQWLRREGEAALIILDNAEAALGPGGLPAAVEDMLRCSNTVQVMLTYQSSGAVTVSGWGRPLPVTALGLLPEDDAVRLLCQELPDMAKRTGDMRRLANHYQCNPMVLLEVAVLLRAQRCTLERALSPEDNRPAALLDSRVPAVMLTPDWRKRQHEFWHDVLGVLLDSDVLEAVEQLSVFLDSFDVEGAGRVAPCLSIGLLQELKDLTVLRPAGEGGREFLMHPLHREVAFERLAAKEDKLEVARDCVLESLCWNLAQLEKTIECCRALNTRRDNLLLVTDMDQQHGIDQMQERQTERPQQQMLLQRVSTSTLEGLRKWLDKKHRECLLVDGVWLTQQPEQVWKGYVQLLAEQGFLQLGESDTHILLASPMGFTNLQQSLAAATQSGPSPATGPAAVNQSQHVREEQQITGFQTPSLNVAAGESSAKPVVQHADYSNNSSSNLNCQYRKLSLRPWRGELAAANDPTPICSGGPGTFREELTHYLTTPANAPVHVQLMLKMQACSKQPEKGSEYTTLCFKVACIHAAATTVTKEVVKRHRQFKREVADGDRLSAIVDHVQLSLASKWADLSEWLETTVKNGDRVTVQKDQVTGVAQYKFKEWSATGSVSASMGNWLTLGGTYTEKQAAVPGASVGSIMETVAIVTKGLEPVPGSFSPSDRPCTVQLRRYLLSSLVCGHQKQLGTLHSGDDALYFEVRVPSFIPLEQLRIKIGVQAEAFYAVVKLPPRWISQPVSEVLLDALGSVLQQDLDVQVGLMRTEPPFGPPTCGVHGRVGDQGVVV